MAATYSYESKINYVPLMTRGVGGAAGHEWTMPSEIGVKPERTM